MATPKAKTSKKLVMWDELQPGALSAELIGTFILATAVLMTSGNVIFAALTVVILVLVLGKLSGAHINPAVTIALLATRNISAVKAFGFIVAQLFGALLAFVVASKFAATADPTYMSTEVFKAAELMGTWRPFWAELLGATLFGFGVSSAVLGKKEGFDAAFTVGGSLLVGLVVASIGSGAVLNPAVALGISAYTNNGWSIAVYALAPVLGATAGAWLFKLLQSDIAKNLTAK